MTLSELLLGLGKRTDMKFCKDCRHAIGPQIGLEDVYCWRCKKTTPIETAVGYDCDLVTGSKRHTLCTYVRYDEKQCGMEGKWFEPKE